MEDKSLFTSSQPPTISEGLQNFIDAMVEEIVLEGKPFDTQKKYLRKFSENEGLDYENLEADITTFIEILDSLKVAFTKVQVKLAEEKGRDCHISEATVKKLVNHSSHPNPPKKKEPKPVTATSSGKDEPEANTEQFRPKEKKKEKKKVWPWIAAAMLLTVIIIVFSVPSREEKAFKACNNIDDYRNYVSLYGMNGKHYYEVSQFIQDFVTDSMAMVEAERKVKEEEVAYNACTTIAACDSYLDTYPKGTYVKEVMTKKSELEKSLPNVVITTSGSSLIISLGDLSFKMIRVEGGSFKMGVQNSDPYGDNYSEDSDSEWFGPVHSVVLNSYYMAETEVTQALWKAVLKKNPSYFRGDNLPVESVNISDCQIFIDSLNLLTGKHFRLPTEAEWEYAARGGKKSKGFEFAGSNNPDEVGWTWSNSQKGTKPVKRLKPNELGLYDMTGNVLEWCSDRTDGSTRYKSAEKQINPQGQKSGIRRIDRGGCWEYGAMEVWYRHDFIHSSRINRTGLRLALSE